MSRNPQLVAEAIANIRAYTSRPSRRSNQVAVQDVLSGALAGT